jgi:glycosyltransferase involved in cell wall biosynthesis
VNSLRILVAANVAGRRAGGMVRLMAFTGDALTEGGHRIEYFYAEEAARYGASGRWSRFTFPVAIVRYLRDRLREGVRYDVVNVHEPCGVALLFFRGRVGDPAVVATSHGVEKRAWELALEERGLGRDGPSLKTRLVYPASSLWQSAYTLRHADHIFCLNEQDRGYLAHWLGPDAPLITRVGPGVDKGFADAAAGRDYARADRLLFAGTWRKNKGIEDLVPAFIRLAERRPNLTLTVLGGGIPRECVLRSFPESVRPRVRCVTTSTEAETMAAFAQADLFVLPSLFEGTPLTLLEAMGSGLPIVTTATCGMLDVIRDGENGLLVPIRSPEAIATALGRLLDDRALREKLGRAAQSEALARYSWRQAAEPMRQAYEDLASRAQHNPR